MKVTRIIVVGLAIETLGFSADASAQEWGQPPPGWGTPSPPPPPAPPPSPPSWSGYDGGYGCRDAGYGYRP